MLNRITAALGALLIAAPAYAAPAGLDAGHTRLWNELERQGVLAYVNPEELCGARGPGVMGAYGYNPDWDVVVLGVCQDNRDTSTEAEVAWTDNDLDTLRHESMHYLQDCIGGKPDGELDPFYDGAGWAPGNYDYDYVLSKLGVELSVYVLGVYSDKGNKTVRLEHEAFMAAQEYSANDIAQQIAASCPVGQ